MLQVTVVLSGDKEFKQKITKLGKELYKLKSAMEEVGESLDDYYENIAFPSQGGVFHAKWAPLAKKTIQYRKKAVGASNAQPLMTGHSDGMQHSFNYEADQTSVYVSNSKSYFKYHQSSAPRRRLPRRQMIDVNTAVKNIVRDKLNYAISKKIKALGL